MAMEGAAALGEADLVLVPWGLLGESAQMRETVVEATLLYLQIHSGEAVWIRYPAEQSAAAGEIADRLRRVRLTGQEVAVHLAPEARCTIQASRLVIACGDGRECFRHSLSDLHEQLDHPHVIALPGGPLWLHDHPAAHRALEAWVQTRGIREVVESRHENCGYRAHGSSEPELSAARRETSTLLEVSRRIWRPLTGGYQDLDD